jgi:hypothetical protein
MEAAVVMSENNVVGSQTVVSVANYGSKKVRTLKYMLHPGMNAFKHSGTLKLVHLDYQDSKLMGWFLEHTDFDAEPSEYEVYVAITGERVSDRYNYVTSTQLTTAGGYFVVHAFD